MRREITVGGGHASGQLGWWHFGLGAETEAEVRVIWPDGATGDWYRVKGDGFYRITPGRAPEVVDAAGERGRRASGKSLRWRSPPATFV